MTTVMNKTKDVRPEEVPEVQYFMAVKAKYEALRNQHRAVIQELEHIAEEYNAALEQAEKVCRSQQISCGPFNLLGRPTVKYNAEALLEELGVEAFLKLGGEEKTVTQYVIDNSRCEQALSRGEIPEEVVDKIRQVTCRYNKPQKMNLP